VTCRVSPGLRLKETPQLLYYSHVFCRVIESRGRIPGFAALMRQRFAAAYLQERSQKIVWLYGVCGARKTLVSGALKVQVPLF
jgi:hypothetical protein